MRKSELIRRASDLYERFSGHTADRGAKIKIPPVPPVGVCIGDIDGILYTTVRDGETQKYIHKFRAKDRPLFVVSPDGKQLFLVGGNYNFTERGIIDMSDKKNN